MRVNELSKVTTYNVKAQKSVIYLYTSNNQN